MSIIPIFCPSFETTLSLWIGEPSSEVHLWSNFLGITQFVGERFRAFIEGLPLIIAFCLLGLVDGLVQRDIRKFQNARESALFFHRSKHLLTTVFFTGYFFYGGTNNV